MLSPAVRYVQPVPSFTGGNETPDRSVPGEGHLSLKKRAGSKRKRRAAKAARPGIPGKETLLDVGDHRSSPLEVRRALELVVQVGRRVADADELAGSRVLHADPTHVVEAGLRGGTIVTGTAEREVDPAALEVGRVPVRGRQQVNALGLEEDVVRGRGAGKLTGRAGGNADAAEQVLVVVVREDLDLVHRVIETSVRVAVVAGLRGGVRPGAKVDIDALVVVAAPHDDPGLEAVGLVGEVAEAVTVAERLAAVAAEVVRSGDVRVPAASRRELSGTSGSRDGRDELAEEGLRRANALVGEARVELDGDSRVARDVATLRSAVNVEHVADEDVRRVGRAPAQGRDRVLVVEVGLVGEEVRAVVHDVDREVAGEGVLQPVSYT